MTEKGFSEIRTERLTLRKLKNSDWESISYLRSDKIVNEFVTRPSAESKDEALEFIAKICNGIENRNMLYWAIAEKGNDQMIGSICLWNFSKDGRTAEVGYDLSPKFQGKGIMSESLKFILEFGFETLDLNLIEAYTSGQNERSKKLLERNHFVIVVGKNDDHNQNNLIYGIGNPKNSISSK